MARRKTRMTSKEFFRALRKLNARWFITGAHAVRCRDYANSPIERLCREKFGLNTDVIDWQTAACKLGLDVRFARRLVEATDNTGHYHLRDKLLRATGLM